MTSETGFLERMSEQAERARPKTRLEWAKDIRGRVAKVAEVMRDVPDEAWDEVLGEGAGEFFDKYWAEAILKGMVEGTITVGDPRLADELQRLESAMRSTYRHFKRTFLPASPGATPQPRQRQRLASAGRSRQAAGQHPRARTGRVAGDGEPARLGLPGRAGHQRSGAAAWRSQRWPPDGGGWPCAAWVMGSSFSWRTRGVSPASRCCCSWTRTTAPSSRLAPPCSFPPCRSRLAATSQPQ
jgi:hypothetical protein